MYFVPHITICVQRMMTENIVLFKPMFANHELGLFPQFVPVPHIPQARFLKIGHRRESAPGAHHSCLYARTIKILRTKTMNFRLDLAGFRTERGTKRRRLQSKLTNNRRKLLVEWIE